MSPKSEFLNKLLPPFCCTSSSGKHCLEPHSSGGQKFYNPKYLMESIKAFQPHSPFQAPGPDVLDLGYFNDHFGSRISRSFWTLTVVQ